ncbi:hypothetical protein FHW64_003216 [Variovorax sp. Sphag1AA]|nr:hypothetical protein [Variovorax sp. Sphag1AA]
MRNVLPLNMMAIALGLHVRCGIEDNIWNQRQTGKMTTVEQIEQLVRIARGFAREVANGKEAREIYWIGTFYENADEALAQSKAKSRSLSPPPRAAGWVRWFNAASARGWTMTCPWFAS